ncbi:DUF6115 domain-containing protein [Piscibacillus sp. B03]|uniref:DUF6115 domain-containing protein n=1 Tax=Piscibacillus sp. B03 TaxID=3457430 RepID=UPI003FCDB3B3
MSSFLITLSLLLHGITFFVIVYLYQKIQHYQKTDENFERRVKETEDLFNSYILELKDENEKLIHSVSKTDSNNSISNSQKNDSNMSKHEKNKEQQIEINTTNLITEQEDRFEPPSVESKILNLYNQGYTIDEIAKKLNMGHTEVDLTIKFHQKIHL